MRLHVHGSDVRVHYSSIKVSSRHIHLAIVEVVDVREVSITRKSMLRIRQSPTAVPVNFESTPFRSTQVQRQAMRG